MYICVCKSIHMCVFLYIFYKTNHFCFIFYSSWRSPLILMNTNDRYSRYSFIMFYVFPFTAFHWFGGSSCSRPLCTLGCTCFFWYSEYVASLLVLKGLVIWSVSFAWFFRTFSWSAAVRLQLSWSLTIVLSSFVLKDLHSSDLSPLQFIVPCGSDLCSSHCGGKRVTVLSFVYQNLIFLHSFSKVVKQLKANYRETRSNHWNCYTLDFSQLPGYKPSSLLNEKKGFCFVADSSMKMSSQY